MTVEVAYERRQHEQRQWWRRGEFVVIHESLEIDRRFAGRRLDLRLADA
jgi:hypothetical protein